jgi:hypothetical protein
MAQTARSKTSTDRRRCGCVTPSPPGMIQTNTLFDANAMRGRRGPPPTRAGRHWHAGAPACMQQVWCWAVYLCCPAQPMVERHGNASPCFTGFHAYGCVHCSKRMLQATHSGAARANTPLSAPTPSMTQCTIPHYHLLLQDASLRTREDIGRTASVVA